MIFFNEEFEYLMFNVANPSNMDLQKHGNDDKKTLILEGRKSYAKMMLTELGARGWELITKSDNSWKESENSDMITVDQLIFKRSSRSKHYKTGFGVNVMRVNDLAKKEAENEHIKPINWPTEETPEKK